ncbi:hypothetical protein GCM10018952_40500 [Streptosporangium vulgare]
MISPRSPALADFAATGVGVEPGDSGEPGEPGDIGVTEDAGSDAGTFSSSSSEGLAGTVGMSETGTASGLSAGSPTGS